MTIARLALRLPATTGPVPVKSIVAAFGSRRIVHRKANHDRHTLAVSGFEIIGESVRAARQAGQRLPHFLLGRVLDVIPCRPTTTGSV